jgi:hypothetical protein
MSMLACAIRVVFIIILIKNKLTKEINLITLYSQVLLLSPNKAISVTHLESDLLN